MVNDERADGLYINDINHYHLICNWYYSRKKGENRDQIKIQDKEMYYFPYNIITSCRYLLLLSILSRLITDKSVSFGLLR